MSLHTLSERAVAAAITAFRADPNARDKLLSDGGGLYIRLRKNAAGEVAAAWTFIYTQRGTKQKAKLVLGTFADHATSAARAWAAGQRRLLDTHSDPVDARREVRRAASDARDKTLGALIDAYVAYLRAAGKPSADDTENLFKNHVPDSLRRRVAAAIGHVEFVELLNGMTNRNGKPVPRTQGKVRTALLAAYRASTRADQQPGLPAALQGFGINAVTNPMLSVMSNPASAGKRGQRVLTAGEFRRYIAQVESLKNPDVRRTLLLQVFTGGQRIAQLIAARVIDGQLLILDGKGKRTEPRQHFVPLIGPKALELAAQHVPVKDLKAIKAAQLLCSGAVRRISRQMGMVANPASPFAEGTPFSLDDIRRSIETLLSGAGVSKDTRAQLLSHGISGVQAAHYDRHQYRAEKTAALRVLHGIVDNVVELRAAA